MTDDESLLLEPFVACFARNYNALGVASTKEQAAILFQEYASLNNTAVLCIDIPRCALAFCVADAVMFYDKRAPQ